MIFLFEIFTFSFFFFSSSFVVVARFVAFASVEYINSFGFCLCFFL